MNTSVGLLPPPVWRTYRIPADLLTTLESAAAAAGHPVGRFAEELLLTGLPAALVQAGRESLTHSMRTGCRKGTSWTLRSGGRTAAIDVEIDADLLEALESEAARAHCSVERLVNRLAVEWLPVLLAAATTSAARRHLLAEELAATGAAS